jgi:hypothetical protein
VTKGKRGSAHRQKRERRLLSGMMLRQDYHRIMGFRRSTASPTWWSRLRMPLASCARPLGRRVGPGLELGGSPRRSPRRSCFVLTIPIAAHTTLHPSAGGRVDKNGLAGRPRQDLDTAYELRGGVDCVNRRSRARRLRRCRTTFCGGEPTRPRSHRGAGPGSPQPTGIRGQQ